MSGLDWLLIIIIIVITGIQIIRGLKDFDLVLYETITLIVAVAMSVKWHLAIANKFNFSPSLVLLFLFLIIEIILLLIANFIAHYTEFSWEPFNGFICFFLGLICSWTILHLLLRVVSLQTDIKIPILTKSSIESSVIAQELLKFKIYNAIINFLNRVGSSGG
ncbi:MAG: hypothetical protein ABIK19_01180 [candidate division WOR-3 bacterium]